MSISVGGVDLAQGIIDAQYRIATLEKIVEHLVRRNPGSISEDDVRRYRQEALADLQRRYPDAGIQPK